MRLARIALGFLATGMLCAGLTGCEQGNETTALDSVGATGANGAPPPKNQKEYMEQQKAKMGGNPMPTGYPGMNNKSQ